METKEITINGATVKIHSNGTVTRRNRSGVEYTSSGIKFKTGYCVVSFRKKRKFMHRLVAMCFLEDYDESLIVDHIDGNPSNNDISNLRCVTHAQNKRAWGHQRPNSKSRYRGVSLGKGRMRWAASVCYNAKKYHVGRFKSQEAAALAYDRKAEELGFFPEAFNKNNFPELASLCGA
jgi:hypothetical protein